MIPWFQIFLLFATGFVAFVSGIGAYITDDDRLDGKRRMFNGFALMAATLLCALWNACFLLGRSRGWW